MQVSASEGIAGMRGAFRTEPTLAVFAQSEGRFIGMIVAIHEPHSR
jgi:hypothetical protein